MNSEKFDDFLYDEDDYPAHDGNTKISQIISKRTLISCAIGSFIGCMLSVFLEYLFL